MKMSDRLSAVRTVIGNNTVTVFQSQFSRQFGDNRIDMTDDRTIFIVYGVRAGDMGLGNDQKMGRSLRVNIVKSISEIVLIDLLRRDLARNNITE